MVVVLFFTLVFSYLKYIVYFPYLVRKLDSFLSFMLSKLYLASFGANNIYQRFHGSHPDFNYLQFSEGK